MITIGFSLKLDFGGVKSGRNVVAFRPGALLLATANLYGLTVLVACPIATAVMRTPAFAVLPSITLAMFVALLIAFIIADAGEPKVDLG
jgi:hypothetical protein